jgi:hypothetical protein
MALVDEEHPVSQASHILKGRTWVSSIAIVAHINSRMAASQSNPAHENL